MKSGGRLNVQYFSPLVIVNRNTIILICVSSCSNVQFADLETMSKWKKEIGGKESHTCILYIHNKISSLVTVCVLILKVHTYQIPLWQGHYILHIGANLLLDYDFQPVQIKLKGS